ncbi:MAG: ribonuclease Z [Clostridia bacterium]|nr:ribonuclease Z [Clostridia bacterium]
MKLIVCIDDRGGMAFNQRRQSRDRALCEDVASMVRDEGVTLFCSPYSAPLFAELSPFSLCEDADYAARAGVHDYCFCERESPAAYAPKATMLIVYRWNRHYPSDLKFDISLDAWTLQTTREFAGNSHEKITKEIYVK